MRMMKNNKNETIMVIGIDHGYGNMKTATRCFTSGVVRYEKEPISCWTNVFVTPHEWGVGRWSVGDTFLYR